MTRDRLLDSLHRAYDGTPWHGPSCTAVLSDVTAAEAAWRPQANAHSIWAVVLHMRSWTEEVLRRAQGAVPADPERGDWPAVPNPPSAAAWQDTLASLDAAHRALLAHVAAMDDEQRAARVADRPGDPPNSAITQRAMIRSLAEHDVYHTGQLAMLKAMARRALGGST